MCKPASVWRSSRYVTGSDPFLEPKGEAGEAEGLGGSLGAGTTPGQRIASSSLCWVCACKQTRRPTPAPHPSSVQLSLPSHGLETHISPLSSGGCNRDLFAKGSRWVYSGLQGCLVEELKSIWRICVLFRAS